MRFLVLSIVAGGVLLTGAPLGFAQPWAPEAAADAADPDPREVARIRRHLQGALDLLARAPTDHLSPDQRQRRAELIGVLEAYRARGRFPKNRDFAAAMPYFVDAAGTRCALAELVHASGRPDLVAAIATARNNAFVRELANERALLDWLDAHGLSVAEAARIQPAYCFVRSAALCGGGTGPGASVLAIVDATWIDDADGSTLQPDRVYYGTPTNVDDSGAYRINIADPRTGPAAVRPVVYVELERGGGIILKTTAGGDVQLLQDPDCDGAPRLSIDQLVEAMTGGDCTDVVERSDPAWATSQCISEPADAICQSPDAGALPGLPDASAPGASDAGANDDGPEVLAAPAESCRAVDGPTSGAGLLVLAVIAWARRRRT